MLAYAFSTVRQNNNFQAPHLHYMCNVYLNKPIYTCNVDELLENCCVLMDGRESIIFNVFFVNYIK
jgi:hypothetical protein